MQPKLISLLAFRNEEIFLPIYLECMSKIVDVMLGYDDGSTDNSRSIFEEKGGTLIEIPHLKSKEGRGATREIREQLLLQGRALGGSHFIVLDSDEFFCGSDPVSIRDTILALKQSQKLRCDWVMLSGSGTKYLNRKSVWKPGLKDFAFADDKVMTYPNNSFVHFSRTPISEFSHPSLDIPFHQFSVLHLQFLNWELGQIKQCWYRLKECVEYNRNYAVVNKTYDFTKEIPNNGFKSNFPDSYLTCLNALNFESIIRFNPKESWYFNSLTRLLASTRRFKTVNLDIWFLEDMKFLHSQIYGREHKKSILVNHLNKLKLRILHVKYIVVTSILNTRIKVKMKTFYP
jgi:hypothetical protein